MDEQERKDNSEQEAAGEKNEETSTESAVDAEAPVAEAPEEPAAETSSAEPEAEQESAPVTEEEAAPVAEEAETPEAVAPEAAGEEEPEAEVEEVVAEAPGISGLVGRKLGMTTFYTDDGRAVPVTAVEVGPCVVTQVKTEARNGYEAVQIGFVTAKNLNKPMAGHLERSGGKFRHLQEFSVKDLGEFEVGQQIFANLFETGDKVKVSGTSKGKGFAGGVKRYGFAGGPKTHGQSDRHRAPGSIGAGSSPGRVWPGTKMAGHYGSSSITQRGLQVVLADPKRNLVLIGGSVPGHINSIVRIEKQA